MSLRRTGQEGLMLWLQARTSGYKGVNVVDFTKSWENGLAFCALIHSFYPDLIPFDTLEPQNKASNLKLAFDTADKLGVPALMDPEDMLMDCGPDKFSVITYISQYFHKFKNFDKENGSDEVIVKAPPVDVEDEIMKRRQKIEQERMLLKKCAKCSQGFPNGGTIIDALGKQYHPDCFICFSCSKQFKDNKFVNVDSNPYCQQCAKDKFTSKNINSTTDQYDNPPCFKCKKLCEGDTINALGHSWHPDCFACTTCNKVFTSGASKVLNVDGYPYCEQCGRRAFVSRRTVTSPSPSQGMSKSKSMSAIPKMVETPGETASPTAKPLLGGSKISISSRLNAFQAKPEDAAAKKPEPGKLKESALAQRKQEEEQRKKKEEEEKEAKRIKDEEDKEAAQKRISSLPLIIILQKCHFDIYYKEDEKIRKKQEEEEKKRKEQEDKEAKKKSDEENKKKRAEDIKRKKEEEEARKKKEQEEEEERKREKQEQIKRQRADSIAKKMEAEEIKKKEEEERKRKEKEEDEARKEALRKKREDMKLKEKEEEKKKEEATSKRTSIRFLHRSITETFVAHNKLADVQPTTTTKLAFSSPNNSRPTSPVSTPRDSSAPSPSITISPSNSFSSPSTPRDSSSSSSSSVTLNSPHSSPSSLSHSASSSSIVATLVATPRGGAVSPSPSLSSPSSTNSVPTSAAEKSIEITCPAADVMCGWTGSSETVANHSSTCPFVLLRPILQKLQSSNEELARKVDVLQGQQDKDREVIASLQAKLAR